MGVIVADPESPVPKGFLRYTVTYLEMTAPPTRPPPPRPLAKMALLRAERMPEHFYRYLHDTVGGPWLWSDRLEWPEGALAAHLAKPETQITVFHEAGVPIGFCELNDVGTAAVTFGFFGLMPEAVGRKLGPWLFHQMLDWAWDGGPDKVLIDTCTLDHPKALGLYQRAGFKPLRQEVHQKRDPRLIGLLPRDIAPRHPLAD